MCSHSVFSVVGERKLHNSDPNVLTGSTKYTMPKSTGGHPRQKKVRPLTIKEHAVIDGHLKGEPRTDIGMVVFNTQSRNNAYNMVNATLKREVVKNEIEKRLAAQNIFVDRHLKNIDKLAFEADKEDIRFRASQDLADRAGIHFKYVAEGDKENLTNQLSDEAFKAILDKHQENK